MSRPPSASPRMALWKFTARWCRPCKAIHPTWLALAKRTSSRIAFLEIDVDEYPAIAREHGIRSVPTFILWAGDDKTIMKRWTDGDPNKLDDVVMDAYMRGA